jgi:TolA-binding protein
MNPHFINPFFPPLPGPPTALGTAEQTKPAGNDQHSDQAEVLLRAAMKLEGSGKRQAALEAYLRIAKDYSESRQAKSAEKRIKALTGK